MENCFFNCTVAKQTSIPAAILFQNIAFWVETNRANERNYHEGKYWTKNSKRAFCTLFDFMTYAQIKGALSKLLEAGLIEAEQFQSQGFDRSMSYTLTDKGWLMYSPSAVKNSQSIGEKQPMPLAKNSQCISDKKPMFNMNTNINTNINSEDIKEINKEKDEPPIGGEHKKGRTNTVDEEIHTLILEKANGDETVEKLLLDWIANRKAKRAVHTVRAIQLNLEKLEAMAKQSNLSIPAYLNEVVRMGWQAFFPVRQSQAQSKYAPKQNRATAFKQRHYTEAEMRAMGIDLGEDVYDDTP